MGALCALASLALHASLPASPLASVARADEVHVQVAEGACPDASLLEQKLAPLLPGVTLTFDALPAPQASPALRSASANDAGERYTIEVAGLSREVEDPARDCVERARVAAVFIALNLAPKGEATKEPEPAPPVPPEKPKFDEDDDDDDDDDAADESETSSGLDDPPGLQLGLRLFGDGAYATAIDRGAFGGGLGAWLGQGGWRVALTLGALSPVRVSFEPVDGAVSVLRIPIVASADWVLRFGRLELGPSVGFALDVLHMKGVELMRPQTELRLDPGLSLAAHVGLRVSSAVVVRLRLHAEAFARAYELRVDPLGPLAHTPRLWLGASLGLDCRL